MLTFYADVIGRTRQYKPAYTCGERDKYCRATKYCILTFWNKIRHFHNLSQNKTMMGRKRKLQSGSSVPQADNHSWGRWLAIVAMVACLALPCSEAFSLTMEYKPPVKSSVSRIRSSRQSRVSTSHKSAYAGALAPPSRPTPHSFERRMRDLVLPKKKPTTVQTDSRPANLKVVETLLDFKRVVADEEDRVVAVRFYSPFCRVREHLKPYLARPIL